MSDQGKWFKLWESALDDQDLENLSVHEWFCWARLGTYIKKHGKDGCLTIKAPGIALQNLLRVSSFDAVIRVVNVLPGYVVEEMKSVTANVTVASVTLNVKCLNWNKFQGDFSGDRVKRFRQRVTANVTAQEEKRRDVEEKRTEETIPLPPNAFQAAWDRYPNKDGRKAAERHFKATVKSMPDYLDLQKALDNYLKSQRVRDGFIKNGSTWFNNWRDWVNYTEDINNANRNSSGGAYIGAEAAAGKYAEVTENRENA